MAIIHLTAKQFQEIVTEGDRPVLVDFWAPWCVYCRRIEPAYDKIAQQYGDDLIIAKVNIDDEPELARAEQIETIPTMVFYHGGEALDSIVAPSSKAAIETLIKDNLN